MAFYGPSGRLITMTAQGGGAGLTQATIRSVTGLEDLTPTIEDVTGPADTRPVSRPTGFVSAADVVFVVDQDTGGAYDARADLVANVGSATARTIVVTYSAGLTWTATAYIANAKVVTPNMLETHVEVTMKISGTWTSVVA